jgi:hypothetical protein
MRPIYNLTEKIEKKYETQFLRQSNIKECDWKKK